MTTAVLDTPFPEAGIGSRAFEASCSSSRLIVIGLDEPLARDYSARVAGTLGVPPIFVTAQMLKTTGWSLPASVDGVDRSEDRFQNDGLTHRSRRLRIVLFADSASEPATQRLADALHRVGTFPEIESITLVHSCGAILGDPRAAEQERVFRKLAVAREIRWRIVRCGVILSPDSSAMRRARRWSGIHPLCGEMPATPMLPLDTLVDAVETVSTLADGPREITLLGPNRPWRDVLCELPRTAGQRLLAGLAHVLSWMLIGVLLRFGFRLIQRWRPRARVLSFRELQPESTAHLVSLFNRWTAPHVQLAGYNNGVTHFGWRFPGKTVVSTCASARVIRGLGDRLTADAGITLKQCLDALSLAGRDLIVAPNYSYVAAGTAFFVPIHGSGCEVSTLGDTIERVLLYDPQTMRFIRARRGDATFAEAMYNRRSGLLLLRLTLQTRLATRYSVSREILTSPRADELLAALSGRSDANDADPAAPGESTSKTSNVEIRKPRAGYDSVEISRYRIDKTTADALVTPRDRLGRVWDRLEENRLAAFVFHAFVRTCAYHVELFLTPDEFRTFWDAHRTLPLSKIQLRFVRKDALPHSPMCTQDLVSADLFMMRRHRTQFLAFVRERLPGVRFNPGKQSLGDAMGAQQGRIDLDEANASDQRGRHQPASSDEMSKDFQCLR